MNSWRRIGRAAASRAPAACGAALVLFAMLGAGPGDRADRDGFRLALPPYVFQFPRDHAAHPEYRTEWWYYTGHLKAAGGEFGYQITFFRVALDTAWRANRSAWAPRELVIAHAALTDVGNGRFRFDERIARPALRMAGADTARYRVWIDDWSAELGPAGRTHTLRAVLPGAPRGQDDVVIALELDPGKPPTIHGERGVSQKSPGPGNASHYYSLTRMPTRGRVVAGGRNHVVTGTSWMDHEFGTSQLARDQVGWDWFSLQLDDGRDLMLYRLRLADGRTEPRSSGTIVERDGRTRRLLRAEFDLEPLSTWKSPRTRGTYPARWRVRIPAEGLELILDPQVADQELVTRTTGGIAYWEGAVTATGMSRGRRVTGEGYVEMTGYAGAALNF